MSRGKKQNEFFRGALTDAMKAFKERRIPDKRQQELQREADKVVRNYCGGMFAPGSKVPEPIGKVTSIEETEDGLVVHGTCTREQAERLSRHMTFTAAEATLTPEELAALKQERLADPTVCPECHVGYAGGLGWNEAADRCGACGYAGQRGRK